MQIACKRAAHFALLKMTLRPLFASSAEQGCNRQGRHLLMIR